MVRKEPKEYVIICNGCGVIIKDGFADAPVKGHTSYHYCDNCEERKEDNPGGVEGLQDKRWRSLRGVANGN